jgi:hypothetical protein
MANVTQKDFFTRLSKGIGAVKEDSKLRKAHVSSGSESMSVKRTTEAAKRSSEGQSGSLKKK